MLDSSLNFTTSTTTSTTTNNERQLTSSPTTLHVTYDGDGIGDPLNLGSLDTDIQDSLNDLLNSPTASSSKKEYRYYSCSHSNGNGDGNCSTFDDDDDDYGISPSSSNDHSIPISSFHLPPPLMNAVQMEIQENAKVPNLYQTPFTRNDLVKDRHQNQHIHQLQQDQDQKMIANIATAMTDDKVLMDEILRLTEADVTLTERFLGDGQRISAAAAYSNAGALMSSIGTKVASITWNHDGSLNTSAWGGGGESSTCSAGNEGNAGNAGSAHATNNAGTGSTTEKDQASNGIHCTNETSIEHCHDIKAKAATIHTNTNTLEITPIKKSTSTNNQLQQSYLYGRPVPLPIPTKRKSPSSPTKRSNTKSYTTKNTPQRHQEQQQQQPKYMIQSQSLKTQKTSIKSSVIPVSHSAPTPSVLDATKKRSQFGFGDNHFVPSVPLPPTHNTVKHAKSKKHKGVISNAATAATAATAAKATTTSTGKNNLNFIPTSSIPQSQSSIKLTNSNEGASYERKKQRAKDARVKLNESIERLSVAINLAGSQSKQRANAYAYWSSDREKSITGASSTCTVTTPITLTSSSSLTTSSTSSTTVLSPSTTVTTQSIHNSTPSSLSSVKNNNGIKDTKTIMEEAAITADSAKKWERPSFVGSAATMIQNLNAQCEALMRELVDLKKVSNDGVTTSGGVNYECGRKVKCDNNGDENEFSLEINKNECDETKIGDFTSERKVKRMKINHEELKIDIDAIIKRDKVISNIGTFLDPRSILRFMCISKSWQVQLYPLMKSDLIWGPLCVKRFGAASVREWSDNEQNEDLYVQNISQMELYCKMNQSNVKRKSHYEGNIELGNGKIDNIACAWVTAVERSNGETLRSVLTSVNGELKYASLPVVELRILVQNIGIADTAIYIPEQIISIDASTKRRGEEMLEITTDERMIKKLCCADGSIVSSSPTAASTRVHYAGTVGNLTKLEIYESVVLSVFIHARSCSTTSKFRQRANFAKILLNVRGTTLPLVVPINDNKTG